MKRTTSLIILGVILVALLRIWFAYQVEGVDPTAYQLLRQVEHIGQTGLPFFHDDLGFGGRDVVLNPVFAYVISFISKIVGLSLATKVLPNILAACLIACVYVMARKEGHVVAFLSALIAGFIPIFFTNTLTTVSPLVIVAPLVIIITHMYNTAYTQVPMRRTFFYFACILILLDPSAWIWLVGYAIYFLFCWVDRIRIGQWEKESFLTLSCIAIMWTLLWYGKLFYAHGIATLWQNAPLILRTQAFGEFDLFKAITLVGVLPFIAAFFVFYKQAYQKRDKRTILITSQIGATFLLLWFTFIPFTTGLIFLSVWLVVLFPDFYLLVKEYIQTTKFSKLTIYLPFITCAIIILLNIIPSIGFATTNTSISADMIETVTYMRDYIGEDAVIIAEPKYGFFIEYEAGKKTFIDQNFLLISHPEKRIRETAKIYDATFTNTVLEILKENKINQAYIVYNNLETEPQYLSNEDCFIPVITTNTSKVYNVTCTLTNK